MDIRKKQHYFLFFVGVFWGINCGITLKTGTFCMFFAHFYLILTIAPSFESLIVHQRKSTVLFPLPRNIRRLQSSFLSGDMIFYNIFQKIIENSCNLNENVLYYVSKLNLGLIV